MRHVAIKHGSPIGTLNLVRLKPLSIMTLDSTYHYPKAKSHLVEPIAKLSKNLIFGFIQTDACNNLKCFNMFSLNGNPASKGTNFKGKFQGNTNANVNVIVLVYWCRFLLHWTNKQSKLTKNNV